MPSDDRKVYETRVINRDEGVQITEAMIRTRTFHELDFNLALDIFGDSISSFREQCLENVFRQGYEIHEGLLHKIGYVNKMPVNTNCILNGAPDNLQAMLVNIDKRTAKRRAKTFSDWARGLAGKYKCKYED